ncbi:MAG: serine/threonine-protein phosphatase [Actinomycetota bacterium]|nr:serine/threonine-protein phosphatase [Actinomycetota bacterium]
MLGHGQWWDALTGILDGAHISTATGLPGLVDDAIAPLGLGAEIYLIDLAQQVLRPMRGGAGSPLDVDGSVAGRAFRLGRLTPGGEAADGTPTLWVPLLDGTERLGVLRMALPARTNPDDQELQEHCWLLAGLIGHLVMSKRPYGDALHQVQRSTPLSVSSELLWQLLPPLTFATQQLVVSAVLEPYDRIGGDGFDYAVDLSHAFFAIYDAVGHDIQAGLTTALTLAATRNSRREGKTGLVEISRSADDVIAQEAPGRRFVTAVLARLEIATGRLQYLNAGHPAPLLLRANKTVKALDAAHRVPLGVLGSAPGLELGVEQLEPGDRLLLYTDGIVEARDRDGQEFGVDRLIDLAERSSAGGLPAPETLRRLSHIVQEHQAGQFADDATLLLVEWSSTGHQRLLPRSAALRGT